GYEVAPGRAEALVARSAEGDRSDEADRLRALVDLVASGVALVDGENRVLLWNHAARSLLGWTAEEIVGQDAVALGLAPAQRALTRDLLDKMRAEAGGWSGSALLRRRDGGTLLCAVRAQAMPDHRTVMLVLSAAVAGQRSVAAEVDQERIRLLRAERSARAELERARDRLAFVVYAGSRLASSLDVGMTLETTSDLVAPRFARICIIDLWDGRRLERVHIRDGASEAPGGASPLADALRSLAGRQRPNHPALRAVRTARPVVIESAGQATILQMYDDPEARAIIARAVDGYGLITVPLLTRGRVVGVLTLLGPGEQSDHGVPRGEDLAVLEQLASRAAQSIENARLFDAERRLARSLQESERRQRQAALTLQRSLLPAWTHQPEELEVATRYFPGAEEAEVGGDWYDVIPVAPGRTALVIGDVMGRGLRAATLMGQVRTAVRAYARQDLPPKEMLELLDGVVADLGEAEIVTGVYAVFDALAGTLTYASAGHLPLLVVDKTGRCRRLDHESGLPLGVAQCAAPEHVVEIPPGTVVAFYTDGLVEHRQRDVDAGVDDLVRALGAASGGPLESIADRVIDALRPQGGYDDDVGLLLARARRPRDAKGESGVSVTVPHDLSAAPFARDHVAQALRQWGVEGELYDDILLSASELVANALKHGAPPVQVQLRRLPRTIVVEVHDGSPSPPRPGSPGPDDLEGLRRGLQLVKLLSSRWGWRRTQRGKTVWSEHPLQQPPSSPAD
ncbi:MAG TPA: SpoIIE family protein phosphatase, partial [Actinopolymorphaceae bacterium]